MKGLILFASALCLATAAQASDFKVTSPEFEGGKVLPAQMADKFGCLGGNVSPAISWSGAPDGTRSFVVTMFDKDAPTGSGWWHWVVIDIPADVTSLPAGAGSASGTLPAGAVAMRGDAGDTAFLGACPPPGETHTYTITVKALKVDKLPVPPDASAAMVGFAANMNKIGEAAISARGAR